MKHKIIFLFTITALVSSLTSCKKLLDTDPQDEISITIGAENYDVIKAQIVSVYSYLQTSPYYGRDFIVQSEVLADNGEITVTNSNRFVNEANNTPRSQINLFVTSYQNMLKLNMVLANVDKTSAAAADIAKTKGEAYFLRALLYFDMVRSYARTPNHLVGSFDLGVPLITVPNLDAANPDKPARAKVADVYAQIITDLTNAIANLDNSLGKSRANKGAAYALLSRVYLYKEDWANAEAMATNAINAGNATLATVANYTGNWGTPAFPESYFSILFTASDNLGFDCIQSIFYAHPTLGGYGDITARPQLLSDYFAGDVRKTNAMLLQTTKGTQTVYYTLKYPGKNGGFGLDLVPVIRISEMYLNRAEARAKKTGPDEAGALSDLNTIHNRAVGSNFVGLTGQPLVDSILRERRLELAFEGHRLFDLVRTSRDVVKSPSTIQWDDYRLVAPIPQGEIDVNPNLKQNPTY